MFAGLFRPAKVCELAQKYHLTPLHDTHLAWHGVEVALYSSATSCTHAISPSCI